MAFDPTALKNTVFNLAYNSLISRVNSSIGSNLSPSQRSQALESYRTIAHAIADVMPAVLAHIAANGDIYNIRTITNIPENGYILDSQGFSSPDGRFNGIQDSQRGRIK